MEDVTLLTDAEISMRVGERERVRQTHDFASADRLREKLKQIGIEIWDKEKEWRSSDGRKGPITAF